jgi:hypothetical protein
MNDWHERRRGVRPPRRRSTLALVVCVAALCVSLAVPTLGHASGTVDQQQTLWITGSFLVCGDSINGAQIFTAGRSGLLDTVGLFVSVLSEPSASLDVQLRTVTASGLPGSSVLAAASVRSAAVDPRLGQELLFPFASPAAIAAGGRYALVISSAVPCSPVLSRPWAVNFGYPTSYTVGEGYVSFDAGTQWTQLAPQFDFAFKTYVTPPYSATFLRPLDGSTDPAHPLMNAVRNGRVIPIQAQIVNGSIPVTGTDVPAPNVTVAPRLVDCTAAASNSEPIAARAAGSSNTADELRWDAASQEWIYNLDTGALGLASGNCYRIDLKVNGNQTAGQFAFVKVTR